MAGGMNLASKYASEVDESRVAEPLTGTMQNRLHELPAVARRAVLRQGQERSR